MIFGKKTYSRILFVIDLVSILIGYWSGVFLRHRTYFGMELWKRQLYLSSFLAIVTIEILLYIFRKEREDTITDLDPIENLIIVFRHWLVFLALLMLYLFVTQTTHLFSRKTFFWTIAIGVFLDYLFRMLFRRYMKRRRMRIFPLRRIMLVTDWYHAADVIRHMDQQEHATVQITSVTVIDAHMTGQFVEGVPVVADIDTMLDSRFTNSYQEVLIYLPERESSDVERIVDQFAEVGMDSHIALRFEGRDILSRSLIGSVGDYQTIRLSAMADRCKILGINFAVSNVGSACRHVLEHLEQYRGKYITFCNVHTTVMAQDNPDYLNVQNSAVLKFPDGFPIAWDQRQHGYPRAERVAGPDFMEAVFRNTIDGKVRHYFYGASEETIAQLKIALTEKYPGMCVAGMYSPPYKPLDQITPEEDAADMERINSTDPDIVWIGLGAPKQEKWMNLHQGRVNAVMIGVGAGFDFHAGMIKRAPVWIQRMGLEWLYRLTQDPKRLFNRYFTTNFKFIWYLLKTRVLKGR